MSRHIRPRPAAFELRPEAHDAAPARNTPRLRPGLRIYCVGDVHGRSDLLSGVSDAIARDLDARPIGKALTICLGDYVDRGPDSAGVIDLLARGDFPTPLETLRGNHEVMMLGFLAEPLELGAWRRFGGLDTLLSYGVPTEDPALGIGFETARETLLARMPARHVAFLKSTRSYVSIDGYFFCHAGVRPGVPLDAQDPRDLMWIRDDFLSYEGDFGKMIVHGHTPVAKAEIHENRINIDTKAFASGRLTCLVLEGSGQGFLSGADRLRS
jgi:serine/threonine protein phosphatase 1